MYSQTDPAPKQQSTTKRAGSIFHFSTKADLKYSIPAIIATTLTALTSPVLTILLGAIFDALAQFNKNEATPREFMKNVLLYASGIFSLGVGTVVLSWFMLSCWCLYADRQSQRVRSIVFSSLVYKELSWFDITPNIMGALTMANRNIEDLRTATSVSLAFIVQSIVSIVASLALALYKSWSLTLVSLAGLPVVALIAYLTARPINKNLAKNKLEFEKASDSMNWAIASIDTVKLFNAQQVELLAFKNHTTLSYKFYIMFANYMAIQQGISRFLVLAMFVQGFYFGNYLVTNGTISSGAVMTVFWCCISVAEHFHSLSPQMLLLGKGQAASESLKKVIDPGIDTLVKFKRSIGLYPSIARGEIVLKNITFSYPSRPRTPVLTNVNIYIKPFKTTFIIGHSGSGKSTIPLLLLSLYNIDSGSIFIDENKLETLTSHWLFDNIHVVEQQPVLFDTTIAENIRLGRKHNPHEVSDFELQQACEAAFIDFIDALPNGLETDVGQSGSRLSGGQKQRISLARAYISDAPIMVFDEPVSALDSDLRERTLNSINKFRSGKTTIIITHELSYIKPDDVIYFIKDGEMVESGTRNVLERNWHGYFHGLLNSTEKEEKHENLPSPNDIDQVKKSAYNSIRPTSFFSGGMMVYDENKEQDINTLDRPVKSSWLKKILCRTKKYDEEQNVNQKKTPTRIFIREILKSIPNQKLLSLGILFSILNGLSNPLFAFAFSHLITEIVPDMTSSENQNGNTKKWALVVLALAAFDGTTTYGKFALDVVAERWVFKIRHTSFSNVLRQDMAWFSADKRNKSGALNNLLMNQVEDLRMIVTRFLPAIASIVSLAICAMTWAFIQGWKLTLVGLSLMPGFYITSSWYKRTCEKWDTKFQENTDKTVDLMNEIISGIKTVKSLSMESYFLQQFDHRQNRALDLGLKKAVFVGLGFGVSQLFTYITQGLLLWYGMKLISTGEYATQQTMLVFTLLVFSLVTAEQVFSTIPQISNGFEAFWRCIKLEKLETAYTQETQGENLPLLPQLKGQIEFRNLTYGYGNNYTDNQVLNNFSITIHASEIVALIGPSGCGKSTIAGLLAKLYSPQRGRIILDGEMDIRNLCTEDLRKQIAIVNQMPIKFFDGTIEENLLYSIDYDDKKDYTKAELTKLMEDACKECGIHGFINERLQESYQTRISSDTGSSSSLLSGGQLQRLGIARAIIRNPKILILDECTSALDQESIAHIQQMILKHKGKRDMTMILITHQEEMMAIADRTIKVSPAII